ncbi:alpha-2-macroglobulin [bacterium]|nr:alpha-2-macroglobulin [bacterium]
MHKRTGGTKDTTQRKLFRILNRLRTSSPLYKIVIVGISTLVIIGAIIVAIYSRGSADTAKFKITVNQPTVATFQDNAVADFVGPNAIPEPNNNRKIGAPGELVISYDQISGPYAPVFRMDVSDADITANVRLAPAIAGSWRRIGPSALAFRPAHNWPANTRFSVKINPTLINSDVRTNKTGASFTTPDARATVDSFNVYPSSTPQSVIGIAIVSFNYPVNTNKFAERATMRLDGKSVDFTVKFDRFHRTAFLVTSPIKIDNIPQILRLKINRIPSENADSMTQKITANVTIDAADNIFKVSDIETTVADDMAGIPRQILLINTTSPTDSTADLSKYVDLYLLPRNRNDEDTDGPTHKWAADEITNTVIKQSKKIPLHQIDFNTPNGIYQYAFAYNVSEQEDRFLYAMAKAGMPSSYDFTLKNDTGRVLPVPYPQRSVKIAGTGALLAMGGDKKLAISARGGTDAAYINLYKVKSSEINHLISQTYNIFGDMEFKSWSFDAYDMSVVFKKKIGFADTSMTAVNYASVDLGDYLDRTHADKTGIFIVQTGPTQSSADYSDRRLILLTDLGILRKVNMDQTSTVFVSSITNGAPACDVEVYVLGRNGNSIWASRTNDMGRVDIPALPWNEYKNEKAPVAIVARHGNDISFIPYDIYDQRVEYSKYDIEGVYASNTNNINAFLFTDRGIYRPGENVVIGGIVKTRSFKSIAGVPVQLNIRDARGRIILEKIFSLNADGMFDATFDLGDDTALGEYYVQMYSLNAKNKIQDTLGNASFWVSEFTPDNLKISANLNSDNTNGWINPDEISATVTLRNMFGTPATNRRIGTQIILTPMPFKFDKYPEYKFTDNFISGTDLSSNAAAQTISVETNDTQTDSDGIAQINAAIGAQISDNVTYGLTMIIRGFESGGHSVQTILKARVATSKYIVGWHANSDLSYINRGATRSVNIIAVDNTGNQTSATDLKMRIIKRENLTSLIKDASGYYKYQTVSRDKVIAENPISLGRNGMDVNLDTGTPGTYYMQVIDAGDNMLANIEYFVSGDENTTMQSDMQAELKIKLNSTKYKPGDEIKVGVTAPYSGYGLITIERDKIYAAKWFRASTTQSVQTITVPAEFEGTGYVNVSFVRDLNSRDIFTTPYAYAVAPFASDTTHRTIDIKLSAPDIVTDHKLTVKYETNRDARIMIFAVNDGILQVAKYSMPNPIAHFFKKAALQVETYQTLSLILPEYKILREFAKTGGGDYDGGIAENGAATNPFARRTDAPVAFYSGIINTIANTPGEIMFDIHANFNGNLRVFAVASGTSAVGATNRDVRVQSPIIMTINAPTTVAPGDTFDINTVISNLSGDDQNNIINVNATATGPITLDKNTASEFNIPKGDERLWTFGAAAAMQPGAAEINATAKMTNIPTMHGTATLSVRPLTPFTTDIHAGILNRKSTTLPISGPNMYSDGTTRRIYISYGADALIRPLVEYLGHYEWNCTEQLVSRAIPYVILSGPDTDAQIAKTISDLKNRQNGNGSFAMWPGDTPSARDTESDASTAYITAYVAEFLTLARERNIDIPTDMLSRALDYLRTYAGAPINTPIDADAHAFAIYVITANQYVTTAYINMFEEWVDKNIPDWRTRLMGTYIAAAYKIMHQSDYADKIIGQYKSNDAIKYTSVFDNTIANNAMHQYIMRKYFASAAAMPTDTQMEYINRGEYTSFTAAAIIMGLGTGTVNTTQTIADAVTVTADGKLIKSATTPGNFVGDIPQNTKKIEVKCPECGTSTSLTWTVIDQGFPTATSSRSDGIDIIREYYDMDGNRITRAKIGDRIMVKIFVRTTRGTSVVSSAVITDLLPGGFIPDTTSLDGTYDFAEVRADRVIIYTTLDRTESVYSYTVQAGTTGHFAIPPIRAESMYNAALGAVGNGGTFTVTNETNN